jgi:hypothetical protein
MTEGSYVIFRRWLSVLEYMRKESSLNTSQRPPINQIEYLVAYSYSITAKIDTRPEVLYDLNMEVTAIEWWLVVCYQVPLRSPFTS